MTMITLKDGRYKQQMEWKAATNGNVAIFLDTHTNEQVFIKEYRELRYPAETTNSKGKVMPTLVKKTKMVDNYVAKTNRINQKVGEISHHGGDVVITLDFFREGLKIYKVSKLIPLLKWSGAEVHENMSVKQIDEMMQRCVTALLALHNANVLHCDLKPENLFIVKNNEGRYIAMLSDFDDSFFMDEVPSSEEITCTLPYMSPELGMYKESELDQPEYPLTTASDVFTMGIIYHEYLTGEMPPIGDEYMQLYAYLVDGYPLQLSSGLSPAHRLLLSRMMVLDIADRLPNCSKLAQEIKNICRCYNYKYTLKVVSGDRPCARMPVKLLGHVKETAESQEVTHIAAELVTDAHGQAVVTGLVPGSGYKYSLGVGEGDDMEILPFQWEGDSGNYSATVKVSRRATCQLQVMNNNTPVAGQSVTLALAGGSRLNATTNANGVAVFKDIDPDAAAVAMIGTVKARVNWDESCNCRIVLSSTYNLSVVKDGNLVPNVQVSLDLLNSENVPQRHYAGKTDAKGVAKFENLSDGTYAVRVGPVGGRFKWSANHDFVFRITTYRISFHKGTAPVANTKLKMTVTAPAGSRSATITTDANGVFTMYNINPNLKYAIEYDGRSIPIQWLTNHTASVQLQEKTSYSVTILDAGSMRPVPGVRVWLGKLENGARVKLCEVLTDRAGTANLGDHQPGEYLVSIISMPAVYKMRSMPLNTPARITLGGASKTTTLPAVENSEAVLISQDIPANVSKAYSHIIKGNDGISILTQRATGAAVPVKNEKLASLGLGMY